MEAPSVTTYIVISSGEQFVGLKLQTSSRSQRDASHGFMCVVEQHYQPRFLRGKIGGNNSKTIDADLHKIFRDLDAHQAQEIREAYYKIVERLMTLAEALEIADAQQPESAGPLLTEHLYAVEALDPMKRSRLGAVNNTTAW